MSDHELREFARLKQEVEQLRREASNGNGRSMAERLRLNVGTVATILIMGGGSLWAVQAKLNAIEQKLDAASVDRWRGAHQRLFSYELQRHNPTLSVPDVDDIRHRLDVP